MNHITHRLEGLLHRFQQFQQEVIHPKGLYDPFHYILELGGKRIRPVLVQLGAELVGGNAHEVLPIASAVEIFHNFSLVHDDVMDEADLRRGKPTVHKKWDLNTAILSGDVMLVHAFEEISKAPRNMQNVLASFIQVAKGVCVGQQLDMDFESRTDVQVEEYLEMIRLKTAVLLGGALQMGVFGAGGTADQAGKAYAFGETLGIAFQIQDDWLDLFGDQTKVGKTQGGDIICGKKTILVHEARRLGVDEHTLHELLDTSKEDEKRVEQALTLFEKTGVKAEVQGLVEKYTQKAFSQLAFSEFVPSVAQELKDLGEHLMAREN